MDSISRSISRYRASAHAPSVRSSGSSTVRTRSCRRSVASMPHAENVEGAGGMMTRGIPSSRAIATAWSGPPPP